MGCQQRLGPPEANNGLSLYNKVNVGFITNSAAFDITNNLRIGSQQQQQQYVCLQQRLCGWCGRHGRKKSCRIMMNRWEYLKRREQQIEMILNNEEDDDENDEGDKDNNDEEEGERRFVMDYGELAERIRKVSEKEENGETLLERIRSDDDEDEMKEGLLNNNKEMSEELGKASKVYESIKNLFVIMFTRKYDGEDGIYSLAIGGENFILGFESNYEAKKFGNMLQNQTKNLPPCRIVSIQRKDLEEFCNRTKFQLGFVPKGLIITPPNDAIGLDQWEDRIDVVDDDDDMDKGNLSKHSRQSSSSPSSSSSSSSSSPDESEELKQMKQKLENLFGQS